VNFASHRRQAVDGAKEQVRPEQDIQDGRLEIQMPSPAGFATLDAGCCDDMAMRSSHDW
jgi:hypothetical protein